MLTEYLSAGFSQAVATIDVLPAALAVPFSPVRLALLVGWVFLCLYCAQRAQFSPLVSKDHRTIAGISALFLGPFLFLLLMSVDLIHSTSSQNRSMLETIKQRIQSAIESIRPDSSTSTDKKHSEIKLVDSAGRNIKEIYGHGKTKRQDSNILNLTEEIISGALKDNASDILIDPKNESSYTVRYRIDGMLIIKNHIEAEICHAVINSIKAVSNMDISEKRRPQDGAFMAKTVNRSVSFRAATAGALSGEKLSIRVLNQNAEAFTLDNVGISRKQKTVIKEAISKPSGMLLLCGPTGSGKTTTMYAMLNEIDLFSRNVITVEDPVEYVLDNASQIEVNPKADITFAKTLRSILRQDPDVICVGEIRDEETASIALRASQTGHLVIATIHCGSTAAALVRLLDLGISPILMASGLSVIISQRLLRRLCKNCKKPAEFTPAQIHNFRKKGINYTGIFQATGCKVCHGTGYTGRTAIFDILPLSDSLKTQISQNDLLLTQLKKTGDKKGKSNLYKQGLKKIVASITSLEELKRVVG